MISLMSIKNEISELYELGKKSSDDKALKEYRNKLNFLNICKAYLESNPTTEFLAKEKERLKTRIELVENGAVNYIGVNTDKRKWQQEYYKNTGIQRLRKQLQTINYLLKSEAV